MAKVKIRWKVLPEVARHLDKNGHPRRGNVCQRCGSPLTDEKSKRRGFGHKCFSHVPVVIILEIPPSDTQP